LPSSAPFVDVPHARLRRGLALAACFLCGVLPAAAAQSAQAQAPTPAPPAPAPADVAAPPADAKTTPSGLALKVLAEGRGHERPSDNDCVKVHYSGWKRDGTRLSNSRLQFQGEPAVQCVRTAMPGVAEALKTMVVGEALRTWIPARLGFTSDDDDHPAPNVDLTFDLELVDVIKAPPTPEDLKAAPPSARRFPTGVAFRVLHKGTGTQHPSPDRRLTLHYTGWTADGKLFESTVMSGHPAQLLASEVVPGWRDVVLELVVGDKARLWVPAAQAYGQKPARRSLPAGDLVYDVELLAME
jgi:peptidylprolyl isomerase